MALVADNASDLLDQLVLLTKRLAAIADEQSHLFETNNTEALAALNDEAGRLAATYAMESQRIAQNPQILEAADAHLKEALKAETKKFREILAKHEMAIERGKILAEGLVRAIAEEAALSRPTPQAYSPSLRGIEGPRRDTSAIALDRRA